MINKKNTEEEQEYYYNDEEELLKESQTKSKYAMIGIGLGILFAIIAGTVFYFFLEGLKPPVQIIKSDNADINIKEFVEDISLPEEVKEKLPTVPAVNEEVEEVVKPKPKMYKSKIIKGMGGKLDISQEVKEDMPVPKNKTSNKPIKAKKKGYRGGISTVAGVHQYNQNLSLARGTLIPCSLDTRLISMVAGQLSCTVSEDIYSVNGNVLLIEKGSIAVGSYKSTSLANGMNRMYALWDDIRTPNNIIISVGSGSSDELGSAGMVGQVDNHWMQRIGGAVLVSLIDDAISVLSSRNNVQDGYIINSSRNNARTMSHTILRQYISIPPTLYKDHGDLIYIYVNKDIDFSEVYKLE